MRIKHLVSPVVGAALLALSITAMAQSWGTRAGPDTHRGPAQQGGRTQATPGYSGGDYTVVDPLIPPTPLSGTAAGPDTHRGPAQQGGRTQATPGYSYSGGPVVDTTGSITPRSGTASGPDTHRGPAQQGGRTQATPGYSR